MPGSICRTPIKRRTTLSARMWRSRNSTPLALSSSLDRMIASIGPTNRKQSGRSSAAGDMAVTLIGYRRRLFYLKISSVELSEFRPTRNRTHRRNFHRGCEEHPSTDSHDSSSGWVRAHQSERLVFQVLDDELSRSRNRPYSHPVSAFTIDTVASLSEPAETISESWPRFLLVIGDHLPRPHQTPAVGRQILEAHLYSPKGDEKVKSFFAPHLVSYWFYGTPGPIRTADLLLRRLRLVLPINHLPWT